MNKENIWIIYFVGGLFIFFILSVHYLEPYNSKTRSYYNYSNIIKYLDNEVEQLTYGKDEYNIEKYNSLKRILTNTKDEINEGYTQLKDNYKKGAYTFEEYYGRKSEYKYYLKKIDDTMDLLEDKVG